MRKYESMFIVDTKINEDEIKKTVNKVREFLEKSGVHIISFEEWGNRKLAYPIKKRSEGYYVYFRFESVS
jgi:small subunit ribosomal protein S6